ncbi:hypothetical protein PR003_g23073 [Phytophthora rubi]|uniref:Secreted protein n=1 Tax=Phytophthora rubi TaxID=129364 RepID=A0A6A4D7K2_9STRA|nr:hypothetical protein PR001_g27470 [Phytophthora rubi]KAE9299131.1 hypothetical protein PR003_g23073 [Phytophthora rubi]
MSLLPATLYYCLLSIPVCACPYFCRACTWFTWRNQDLTSARFARRGLGSARFAETGALVDPSDDYASH